MKSPPPDCAHAQGGTVHVANRAVGRVDNVYGDRNLVCSCVGMEAYAESQA